MSYKGGKKSNVYESHEGYNLYAECYFENWGYLNSFENDIILKFLGDLKGKKVLDVGCGDGRSFDDLLYAGGELYGVDISPEMLKLAKKRHSNVQLYETDAINLPFEDDSFDVVTAFFFIVHIKDLESVFDEIYRVLKPGGSFILTNINQRKAPKLKLKDGKEIVINSYYHMPKKVIEALENSFFSIHDEEYVKDNDVWINQVVKAIK